LEPPSSAGLAWRPLDRGDVAALTALVQATQEADGLEFRLSAAEAAEYFDSPSLDPERDTIVGVDDDGGLVAWAIVVTFSGDETIVRAVIDGGVHPRWRGRGVGTALVAWGTGRARQLLAASGKDVPGRICVYLDENQRAAERVFRAAGYSPVRYYAELRRALDDSLQPVEPVAGILIEGWPSEDDEVRLAHNEAFADHWGSQPRSRSEEHTS